MFPSVACNRNAKHILEVFCNWNRSDVVFFKISHRYDHPDLRSVGVYWKTLHDVRENLDNDIYTYTPSVDPGKQLRALKKTLQGWGGKAMFPLLSPPKQCVSPIAKARRQRKQLPISLSGHIEHLSGTPLFLQQVYHTPQVAATAW